MDRLDALAQEGTLFIAAIERAAPDAAVPWCPDWSLRDLVHHTGGVHRWATKIVVEARDAPSDEELSAIAGGWPADEDLAAWFRAGHALLLDALRGAPADLQCWAFLRAASPLEFWCRRMLNETTMHRVDAELASGPVSEIAAEQAVDGVDELLTAFLPRRSSRLKPDTLRTIAVQATDIDAAWLVTAGPDGATTERSRADGDVIVRGAASDLYLLVWNRRSVDGLDVSGDAALLDLWRSSVIVRWS